MSVFIVFQHDTAAGPGLGAAIHEAYPGDVYDLGAGAWLISDNSTAVGVSDKIGITTGANRSAIVIEAASYYGRANPAIWSWIKAKWEGSPNG